MEPLIVHTPRGIEPRNITDRRPPTLGRAARVAPIRIGERLGRDVAGSLRFGSQTIAAVAPGGWRPILKRGRWGVSKELGQPAVRLTPFVVLDSSAPENEARYRRRHGVRAVKLLPLPPWLGLRSLFLLVPLSLSGLDRFRLRLM